jgi:hypothetical protein
MATTAQPVPVDATAASAESAAAAGAQTSSLRCVRCRYLLQGLPDDGACPECGSPVAISTGEADLLRHQEPPWLGQLAEGFTWHAGTSLIVVTAMLVMAVWPESGRGGDASPVAAVVYAVYLLAGWMAAWRITAPEPLRVEDLLSLRRCVRLLGCTAGPLALVLSFSPPGSPLHAPAAQLGGALHALLAATLSWAYVRRLALRAPSRRLAGLSAVLMWGYGVTLLLTSVLPWIGDMLFRFGVRLGNVYGFANPMRVPAEFALALLAVYVCLRLRRAVLDARSAAADSRPVGGPAAAAS